MFETLCTMLFPLCLQAMAPTTQTLKSYNIDPQGITVSGVSSGAFMAIQLDVAFSSVFSGAGSIAGGLFWCAEGDPKKAKGVCMGDPQKIDSGTMIAKARELSEQGQIDPLENLQHHKIYLFNSPQDAVVDEVSADKIVEFYQTFLPTQNITTVRTPEAAHGFPTLANGGPCEKGALPWILNCNFDTAGDILKHLYGDLRPRTESLPTNLRPFNQSVFGGALAALYHKAWIYVPTACAAGAPCRLHVALHGCQMNPVYVQDKFVTLAGYNEWAESNNIIILYPQSAQDLRGNPYACWDWFGFTGPDYVTRKGAQMSALMKMIDRVRGL